MIENSIYFFRRRRYSVRKTILVPTDVRIACVCKALVRTQSPYLGTNLALIRYR
jgi:hypothetical protein